MCVNVVCGAMIKDDAFIYTKKKNILVMVLLLYYYLYSDLPISMGNNLQINLWRHLATLLTRFNYFPLKKTILCKRSAVGTHKKRTYK